MGKRDEFKGMTDGKDTPSALNAINSSNLETMIPPSFPSTPIARRSLLREKRRVATAQSSFEDSNATWSHHQLRSQTMVARISSFPSQVVQKYLAINETQSQQPWQQRQRTIAVLPSRRGKPDYQYYRQQQIRYSRVLHERLRRQRQTIWFRSFFGIVTLQVITFLLSWNMTNELDRRRLHLRKTEIFESEIDPAGAALLFLDEQETKEKTDGVLQELEDWLSDEVEGRLFRRRYSHSSRSFPRDGSSFSGENAPPLDNYYSRQHITFGDSDDKLTSENERQHRHQQQQQQEQQHQHQQQIQNTASMKNNLPPILVVGGSDGSGTRAFVDILGKLGVPMLSDDGSTFDVHGQRSLFAGAGWPPLVKMVFEDENMRKMMEKSKSATVNYEFEDLSNVTQVRIIEEMANFKAEYEERGIKLVRSIAANKRLGHGSSKNVLYGFKAPVSMLLLPILLKVYGNIKFLHVIRDGRDIALSNNQSPVRKFYDSYYFNRHGLNSSSISHKKDSHKDLDDGDKVILQAMELWNDWNTQALDFSQEHNDGENFDYLVMRTEDLLDPRHKFESLHQLAHFVGSPRTDQELCQLSRLSVVDMGRSIATNYSEVNASFVSRDVNVAPLPSSSSLPSSQSRFNYSSNLEEIHDYWEKSFVSFDERFGIETERIKQKMIKEGKQTLYQGLLEQRLRRQAEMKARREKRFRSISNMVQLEQNEQQQQQQQQQNEQQQQKQQQQQQDQQQQQQQQLQQQKNQQPKETQDYDIHKFSTSPRNSDHELQRQNQHQHRRLFGEKSILLDAIPRRNGASASFVRKKDITTSIETNSSSISDSKDDVVVQRRYGRWVNQLQERAKNSTLLYRKLHETGEIGLRIFGYDDSGHRQRRIYMDRAPEFKSRSSLCASS